MRTYKFQFTLMCQGAGEADLAQVEHMIDRSMQDLIMDDEFIQALDEKVAVSVEVTPIGKTIG